MAPPMWRTKAVWRQEAPPKIPSTQLASILLLPQFHPPRPLGRDRVIAGLTPPLFCSGFRYSLILFAHAAADPKRLYHVIIALEGGCPWEIITWP
jgi:hypothetical protein